ncbi:MAG: beta-propeller domain-containing protein, partial [Nitrospiria bacterium]
SIFDVSDFSNPILLHKELLGDRGTESEARRNHKAFTFWAEQGLLALPIELHEFAALPLHALEWANETFRGLYVYRVSADGGFKLLGRIKTADPQAAPRFFFNDWMRGIFIDDTVYAVKGNAVHRANINDIPHTVQSVALVK